MFVQVRPAEDVLRASAAECSIGEKPYEVSKIFKCPFRRYYSANFHEKQAFYSASFEGKKWSTIALCAWGIVVDNCAVCRDHIKRRYGEENYEERR